MTARGLTNHQPRARCEDIGMMGWFNWESTKRLVQQST